LIYKDLGVAEAVSLKQAYMKVLGIYFDSNLQWGSKLQRPLRSVVITEKDRKKIQK